MTLGQAVSNAVSMALVGGWVGLRAYEMWQYYNRDQEEETGSSADDELALLQHEQRRRRSRASGPIIFTYSSTNGAQIFHGGGLDSADGAENPLGVDLLNLQLGLIDRDFDDSDYEMLLALDRDNPGRGAPVSEEQLAALPQHSYHSATAQQADSGRQGSSAYHQALQARYGGDRSKSGSSTAAARTSGEHGSSSSAPAAAEAPTCSICLDEFQDGAQVSALPCFHTYHRDCLEPWLRQQGRSATCPICKTPVFEQR